ncbi:MAG: hypothetical protein JWN07_3586 [Hyphomicrobiales bacterium]|nr:hypothetical protein [Hyphomicrobiales bacterium]
MRSFRSDVMKGAALTLVLACGACSDVLARRDTIAYSAGNSIAANRAIQVIDPYPRRSFLRGQPTDGLKAQQSVKRYLAPDAGLSAPTSIAPPSAGASASGLAAPTQ